MATLKLRLNPNGYLSKKTGKIAIVLEYMHKDKRKLWSTNEECLPHEWDSNRERINLIGKNIEVSRINTKILEMKSKISWLITEAERQNIEPTVDYITYKIDTERKQQEKITQVQVQKFKLENANKAQLVSMWQGTEDAYDPYDTEDVNDFEAGKFNEFYYQLRRYRKTIKRKKIKSSHDKVVTLSRRLKEFDTKRALTFDSFDLKFFNDFEYYLRTCKISDNTVWTYMKSLKAFLNYTFDLNLHKNLEHKKYKLVYHEPVIIAPTLSEIMSLHKHTFSDPIKEKYKKMFVLNCFIGARFGDFVNLKKENFQKDGIYYFPQKVEEIGQVYVPYYDIAKELLEHFNYKIPRITNQQFNNHVTTILKESELFNRVVEVQEFYGGKAIKKFKKLHEVLTSHSCRKFFCSLHANSSEFNLVQAMALSGHKKEENFRRYVVIQKENLNSGVSNMNKILKAFNADNNTNQ